MDIAEFLKKEIRMCDKYTCKKCPVSSENNGTGKGCELFKENYTENMLKSSKNGLPSIRKRHGNQNF